MSRLGITRPAPADVTKARALLARLDGSTRGDRTAFAYGYVLAVDHIAPDLTDAALIRHLKLAWALHEICSADYR